MVKFPGKDSVEAKNIWVVDEHKRQVSLDRGLRYISLWESELKNEKAKSKLLQFLRN